jgi:hypothetical protein
LAEKLFSMAHADTEGSGPWNPGISSEMPAELRSLVTLLRPENTRTSIASALELQKLTALPLGELVALRPERLLLHELLIRVTADFSVPDGSRIEDLGINFREIVRLLLTRYLAPNMPALMAAFEQTRSELTRLIQTGLAEMVGGGARPRWDLNHIAACQNHAATHLAATSSATTSLPATDLPAPGPAAPRLAVPSQPPYAVAYRSLAQVMSALFAVHGQPWGTPELIVSLATDLACNTYGSEVLGKMIEPLLQQAAREQGYGLLPPQPHPVVINTKGPSASGKSTLRPLQKRLAGAIGVPWSDFALISPDIWRKQLLDYASLGKAYKYAGALTSDELQVVDQKLDRYMALKHSRGAMSHLLIDRFRFDSFAADSDQAGSNLLTRFGHSVYLFFMITPPEQLVERAWNRGLEVGRYKAVDDTLAHSVEAYAGIPNVFFTWIRRSDKHIHFEFLDNSVRLGVLPRTVAYGSNDTIHVLDVSRLLDIERFGRVNIEARTPGSLYVDRSRLEPQYNLGFLKQCIGGFREVIFAEQASGRIYLRMLAGRAVLMDRELLDRMVRDPDVRVSFEMLVPDAINGTVGTCNKAQYLGDPRSRVSSSPTIGAWGAGRSPAANAPHSPRQKD